MCQRSESHVKCFNATSQYASFTPRCWWEMRDFVSNAFRFCRCVGSLQVLWHGRVNCAFQVTPSLAQQSPFVQKSRFNHFFHKYTAPHLYLCVPLEFATACACHQLVQNCSNTQLITHEVREMSESLVWSGLSLTLVLQVTHPTLLRHFAANRSRFKRVVAFSRS